MNKTNNSRLTPISKVLRKNMTKEEKHLWYDFLSKLLQTVHRQKVIGDCVVDFYCASAKIVIELDGSQHRIEVQEQADRARDLALNEKGIIVLRYSNTAVRCRFCEVCENILYHIDARTSNQCTTV